MSTGQQARPRRSVRRKGTGRSNSRRGTHSRLTKQEVSSEQEPGRSLFLFDAQLYPSSDLELIFILRGRSQLGQEEKAYGQVKEITLTYEKAKLSYYLVPAEGRLHISHLIEAAVVPQPHRSIPQTHL